MPDQDEKTDFAAIIDVQSYWADNNPETTARIKSNLDSLRGKFKILWIYAQEATPENEPAKPFQPVQFGNQRLEDIPALFHNAARLMYDPVIQPHPEDWIVGKETTDGFSNPHLAPFLKDQNVTQLYVAGFMTDYCVYDTASSGIREGFSVTLLTNLTADVLEKTETDLSTVNKFNNIGIKIKTTPGF